jgi:kynureninase
VISDRWVEQYISHDGIYLLNHSVGLPLRSLESTATTDFWLPWRKADSEIWTHWLAAIDSFRAQLAFLLNGEKDSFCPQTSLSSAVAKILDSLPVDKERNCILMSEEDFPSIAFALQKAGGAGYRLKFIPAEADTSDIDVWDQQTTSDVAMILVTHVQSNNGRQLPVQLITNLSRQKNILSLVDIAQSAAILPIDLQAWAADFVVGSCVKWIGGGPGAGFLWVSPDVIERCEPQSVGWFSHSNPFEFDIHNFNYAPDALRFWGGTPSVLPYVVASHSLKFINNIGVDNIRAHNIVLVDKIIQAISPEDLVSPMELERRGGTLILDFRDRDQDMIKRLRDAHVQFDARAKGIRLSPHLCNNSQQIDALIKFLN